MKEITWGELYTNTYKNKLENSQEGVIPNNDVVIASIVFSIH